ncbi:MAG: type II secretion system protein GspE [Gemmatimonadetes bacterium]|nr:MAG: type II secretion system protein GspE [Gemmatimonadota bacterium]
METPHRTHHRPRLGERLVARGAVTDADVEAALRAQARRGGRLGELLVAARALDDEALARALAEQLGLPYAPPPLAPDPEARGLLPWDDLAVRGAVPLALVGRRLRLAVRDPLDAELVADVRFRTGRPVEVVVAGAGAVERALAELRRADLPALIERLPRPEADAPEETLEALVGSAPVVRVVDHVLGAAADAGASDVHIERHGDHVRVRQRVDGVLHTVLQLPAASHAPIASRLKVMAGMDIAVRRRPQDGGFAFTAAGRERRVRVSTLPVEGGEKVVLRILDPRGAPRGLDQLGMDAADARLLRRLGRVGQGVILAVGPTGSGKSSSLFAALHELNEEGRNVVTIEDPVEYTLPGVNQVQVQPQAGVTFPAALRAILRQDPDVIMVGEIRDRETAEIAMAAAVTGHLVLSTLHTWDAPGAITRLLDMGVPPYLVAGGLSGVVAQRLVRTVCPVCRARSRPGACSACTDGYRGRTGIFQVLALTDVLRDAVARGAREPELRRLAAKAGMRSLAEDARRAVAEGRTTPHEVAHVLLGDAAAAAPCPHCGREGPLDAPGCPHCGRPRRAVCACGRGLEHGWRYCPECLRPRR